MTRGGWSVRRGACRTSSRASPGPRRTWSAGSAARRDRPRSPPTSGVDIDEVIEALTADGCFTPTSLDGPVGDGSSSLGDLLGFEDRSVAAAEARIVLEPLVATLPARDQRILRMRFVDEATQQEIAEAVGLTQAQVSRVLTRILSALRADLTGYNPAA